MMTILPNYIDNLIELFINDFSIFGPSFDLCLANLSIVLKSYEEVNLVLRWEKSHFMA